MAIYSATDPIPYCGAYPALLSAIVGSWFSGGRNAGPSYWLAAIATNLLLGLIIGSGIGWAARVIAGLGKPQEPSEAG